MKTRKEEIDERIKLYNSMLEEEKDSRDKLKEEKDKKEIAKKSITVEK